MSERGTAPEFIFVGGIPRSGTSLVQKILDLHSEVYAGPEMGILSPMMAIYRRLSRDVESGKVSMVLDDQTVRDSLREFLHSIYGERAESGDLLYISEKTPGNLHVFDRLTEVFPESRFVWVIRDPRDVICSMRGVQARSEKQDVEVPYGRWLHADLASIRRGMEAGEAFRHRHGDRLCVVYYEDVLSAPEAEAARLADFLGLEYQERMLHTERPTDTSQAIQSDRPTRGVYYTKEMFDRPIDSSNAGKWRDRLNRRELRAVEMHLGGGRFPSLARYEIGEPSRLWTAYHTMTQVASAVAQAVARRLRSVAALSSAGVGSILRL